MRLFRGMFNALWLTIGLAVVFFIVPSLFGCTSTRYVPVETVRTEVVTKTDTVRMTTRDTLRMVDSVFVSKWTQGDTVYISKEKTAIRWRTVADTVYQWRAVAEARRDSVSAVVRAGRNSRILSPKRQKALLAFMVAVIAIGFGLIAYFDKKK